MRRLIFHSPSNELLEINSESEFMGLMENGDCQDVTGMPTYEDFHTQMKKFKEDGIKPKVKVMYAAMPIQSTSIDYLIQVLAPVKLVPYVIRISGAALLQQVGEDLINRQPEHERLKTHIRKYLKENQWPFFIEDSDIELVEAHLLVPKESMYTEVIGNESPLLGAKHG